MPTIPAPLAPWASLFRLPNLATAAGDAVAGGSLAVALAGAAPPEGAVRAVFRAAAVEFFLYLGGLADNDLCDMEADRASGKRRPLATGALTNGATLTELTAAYQIMGNGGMYYKPAYYSTVYDSNGVVVLEQDTIGKRAISEDSAWITNRMMLKVVQDEYGTGKNAKLGACEVVGKTGTANDESNLLFAGLTPQYVACYRIAYDDNHAIGKLDGWRTMALVWHDVMVNFVDTEKEQSFVPDASTLELRYCTETGLLATSRCPDTSIGYYRQSNIPPSCDSRHDGHYWAENGDLEIPLYE